MAMQNLGGECVFSSEWDKNSQLTYLKNYGELPFGDITKEEVELPEYAPGFRNFDSTFTGTTVKDVEIVDKSI